MGYTDVIHRAANGLYDTYLTGYLAYTSRRPIGMNIYERQWDAMIILDACRTDALQIVADEYDFLQDIGKIWSVGSYSLEWMANTFTSAYAEDIESTSYVTGNPYVAAEFFNDSAPPANRTLLTNCTSFDTVPLSTFGFVDEVQRYGIDDDTGVVLPNTITDRAISAGRQRNDDRLLVHYMQPHDPFIGGSWDERQPFHRLREGTLERKSAWNAYLDNLRFVLDSVELLLENLDADNVVISADHGEAFGELGFYGHLTGFPHPVVKQVPWVRTNASDTKSYKPSVDTTTPNESLDLEDHLESLGYLR